MPLVQRNIKMPVELWEAVRGEAAASGISASEFVRQAITARIAWSAAIRSVQAGLDPEEALNFQGMISRFARLSSDEK